MRIALVAVVVAACTSSGKELDLEPTAQGACSNLEPIACRADVACQLAYVDSGFQPRPSVLHCLELQPGPVTIDTCPQDRDACRARADCGPVFWQELGPDDGPVGDPTYQRCASEAALAEPQ